MDAVELNYPVDVVAPSKLVMGSDSFDTVKAAAAADPCNKEHVSVVVTTDTPKVTALESASSDKLSFAGSRGSCFYGSELSERNSFLNAGHLSSSLQPEGIQRKGEKVSRSSNLGPKRPRMTHDPLTLAVVTDGQISSDQVGSYTNGSISLDRTLGKQKNGINSKRGERRNSKISLKAKYDAFPLKPGSTSFSSAAGGNGFFGAYGLKPDTEDLTELLHDLSLDDLLNCSYEVPALGRGKERRPVSTNENIMVTFRKACSILQPPGSIQAKISPAANNCSDKRVSTYLTSASADASGIGCNNAESSSSNISSSNKMTQDPCSMQVSLPDHAMSKPIHVLEKLGLPTPKDLESLLLDASKSLSRSTSDLRTGKQICRRTNLPPFPWSQTFNGHNKTNSDALKSPLSRTTCQGRWAKIVNPLGNVTGFTNLESLTYDQCLVPFGRSSPDESGSVRLPLCDGSSSSFTESFTSSQVHLESGFAMNSQEYVEQCPIVLAAAQTLHNISILCAENSLDGGNRCEKKPSQKSMKTRKSRSNRKSEAMLRSGFKILLKDVDRKSSKKPRISMVDSKSDADLISCVKKGPISLSTSILSRSSTSKTSRDSVAEARYSTVSMIRHSCMMPPPPRVLDKGNGIHR